MDAVAVVAPVEPSNSKPSAAWMIWTGRVLSGLVVALFLFSMFMLFSGNPEVVGMMTTKYGMPEGSHLVLATIEVVAILLYVVPRTSVLGAILLTAYLGGAVELHFRMQEPVLIPVLTGVVAWGGLFLRDARLRSLMPLRREQ